MNSENTVPYIGDVLRRSPRNWGRWGADDEVGMLNAIGPEQILAAAASIRRGTVFTLQRLLRADGEDIAWPGRAAATRSQTRDESHWDDGHGPAFPGGFHTADDRIEMALQGTTHVDALGHVWYDGELYNGHSARTTIGGLHKAGIEPIARRGIVGRSVLLDIARHRGQDALASGDAAITVEELRACAAAQRVAIRPGDVLIVRTGFRIPAWQSTAEVDEPGLGYSEELVAWFADNDIAALATDTMSNERTPQRPDGAVMHLHNALMRNLGVVFIEMCDLDAYAADCAAHGTYDALFIAAPLRIARAAGAPVNPVVIT